MFLLKLKWWWQLLILGLLSLAIYAPIMGNSFVSDDYWVIRKVCKDGQLNIEGFFRPLSDITLYLNYLLTGLDPAGYYITNILLHAVDTLLLFHFCRLWKWTNDGKKQLQFAALAALLFLTYPFHNEPVVWILGRASLLASTFGMMALVIMVSNWKEAWKITGVATCFFIAMTGYESVMVLPGLVFTWLWTTRANFRRYLWWMTTLGLVLAAHFLLRIWASGSVAGEYGADRLKFDLPGVAAKILKALGRFIFPPLQNVQLITVLFLAGVAAMTLLFFRVGRRVRADKQATGYFISLLAFFGIACLIPFVFGVSTHTSESDRFLHFPSFFFCALVAFVLIVLYYPRPLLRWVTVIIVLYQLVCLQGSLANWRKASGAVKGLLSLVKQYSPAGKVYIVNLPGEIEGAYVFRAGFRDALLLNNLDTADVIVVNEAKREELRKWPGKIKQEATKQGLFIPPAVHLQREAIQPGMGEASGGLIHVPLPAKGTLLFWDKENWNVVQLPAGERNIN